MTQVAVYVPIAAAACAGWLGPTAARRLAPRQATWLLSVGSVVAAAGTFATLALLAWTLVGQQADIAAEGRWSTGALRAHAPAPAIAAAALCMLVALLSALAATAARRLMALRAAYRTASSVASDALLVVDAPAAGAYAVPGRPGRVVIDRGLLSALSPSERCAVIAHERAHLDHGHHWHLLAVDAAAAASPLLRPLRRAVRLAIERWSDEEAARAAGSRRVAARALARSALAALAAPPAATLGAGSSIVAVRVAALLAGPPRSHPALARLVVGVILLGAVAAVVAMKETEHLFESAMRAYVGRPSA